MVDEVLRGRRISPLSKSLISRVLDEMTSGGNRAAPLRQRELEEVSKLASRLWKAMESLERTTIVSTEHPEHTVMSQQSEGGGTLARDVEDPTRESPPIESTTNMFNSPPYGGYENRFQPVNQSADIEQPPSTSSSTDFAQTFDFPQAQMLFLADHLDVDALPTLLDFGQHGLDEWL
jgi:hypothetical protein